jgi:hypothetical protein
VAEEKGDFGADAGGTGLGASVNSMGRLQRRLEALEQGRGQPETISALKLLTTAEIQRALALAERGGVLPNGEVRHPEAFREATPGEREALEHWRKLCGEPLDHLELAEELLDRMGEAHGWSSREAIHAALLLKRLELPDESSWFVRKMAEAVLKLYAVLEEHPDEPEHPKVRGAIRRLERLKEMDRIAPGRGSTSEMAGSAEDLEATRGAPEAPPDAVLPAGGPQGAGEGQRSAEPRSNTGGPQEATERPLTEEPAEPRSWWRKVFGW